MSEIFIRYYFHISCYHTQDSTLPTFMLCSYEFLHSFLNIIYYNYYKFLFNYFIYLFRYLLILLTTMKLRVSILSEFNNSPTTLDALPINFHCNQFSLSFLIIKISTRNCFHYFRSHPSSEKTALHSLILSNRSNHLLFVLA